MRPQKFPRVLILFLAATVFLGTILAGAACADFRFVFLADSRGDSMSAPINDQELQSLVNDILLLHPAPDFLVFGGDLCYRGEPAWWSDWDNILNPLAPTPLYVIKGNHELYTDIKGHPTALLANQVKFQTHCQNNYHNPGDTYPPGHDDYKYLAFSFQFGAGEDKSLFIALDSFFMWNKDGKDKILYGGLTDTQLAWVEDLLKNAAAQGCKHKFIMTHMPVYTLGSGKNGANSSMFALAKLMDRYQVDIFFAGHQHLYDRLFIDKKVNSVFKNTVLHLISGTAGAQPDKKINSRLKRKTILNKYEYVVVDVKGNELEFKAIGGTKDGGYAVIDSCSRQGVWACQ